MAQTIPGFGFLRRFLLPYTEDFEVRAGGKVLDLDAPKYWNIPGRILGQEEEVQIENPIQFWLWVDVRGVTHKQAKARIQNASRAVNRIRTNQRETRDDMRYLTLRTPYVFLVAEETNEAKEIRRRVTERVEAKIRKLEGDDHLEKVKATLQQNATSAGGGVLSDEVLTRGAKRRIQEEIERVWIVYDQLLPNAYPDFKPPENEEQIPRVPHAPRGQLPQGGDETNTRTTAPIPNLPEWLTPEVIEALDRCHYANVPPDEEDDEDELEIDSSGLADMAKDFLKIIVGTSKNPRWKPKVLDMVNEIADVEFY